MIKKSRFGHHDVGTGGLNSSHRSSLCLREKCAAYVVVVVSSLREEDGYGFFLLRKSRTHSYTDISIGRSIHRVHTALMEVTLSQGENQ